MIHILKWYTGEYVTYEKWATCETNSNVCQDHHFHMWILVHPTVLYVFGFCGIFFLQISQNLRRIKIGYVTTLFILAV